MRAGPLATDSQYGFAEVGVMGRLAAWRPTSAYGDHRSEGPTRGAAGDGLDGVREVGQKLEACQDSAAGIGMASVAAVEGLGDWTRSGFEEPLLARQQVA